MVAKEEVMVLPKIRGAGIPRRPQVESQGQLHSKGAGGGAKQT